MTIYKKRTNIGYLDSHRIAGITKKYVVNHVAQFPSIVIS